MDNKRTLLWLDDYRNPFDEETDWLVFSPVPLKDLYVVWIRTYYAFVDHIKDDGVPYAVCLDHDLGDDSGGYTGKDAANFLVEWCVDHGEPIPYFNSQSSNPAGRENIMKYIQQAKETLNNGK